MPDPPPSDAPTADHRPSDSRPDERRTTDRLPRSVVPVRYELTLEPDLEAGVFSGACTTEVRVVEPIDDVVLHAAELDITEATVTTVATVTTEASDAADAAEPAVRIHLDQERERATLTWGRTLTPGTWFVTTRFTGVLNDQLRGFYRSTYEDDEGQEVVLATTQLEATHARRAFPCWDEPDRKATFAVTLVVPEGLAAYSNAREVSRTPRPDGTVAVRFADTMVMSTYLVAFVVGPLEATAPVVVDNVEVRVVHRAGRAHLARYALEVAAHALRFFEDYYGIVYPGGKLDLVAVPDFAFGAMENTGCVTFREVLLLIDPDEASQPERQRLVDVISHEIAHMWFGNLVTMGWWNGIWLNEAFATFMEVACTDAFRPDWERWVAFGNERAAAFDVDALTTTRPVEYEVISPDDAEGMFDVLTYEKGGAVLRMLEQYLGEDTFRDGIRAYLRQHQFANTETTDLWDAIDAVTDEPVRRMMDSWIFQGGFPLVHVEPTGTGIRLRQERFTYLGQADPTRWLVPIILRSGGAGAQQLHKVLLEGDDLEVMLPGADWVHVNWGASGFYRVRYAPELWERLAERADELLTPGERFALVDDAWASVLAGHLPAADFLALAEQWREESDLAVWQKLLAGLAALERILDGEPRNVLRGRIGTLLNSAPARWPDENADDRRRELEALLFENAAVLGDDEGAYHTARRIVHDLGHPAGNDAVPPSMAASAVDVVASRGDAEMFEEYLTRFHHAPTPQEEQRYLRALADFPEAAEIDRLLGLCLTDDVRTQDAPYVVRRALNNRHHGPLAWSWVRAHWDRIEERYPSNAIVRLLEGVRALSAPEVATDVLAFFEDHDVPQGARTLQQHLEKLQVNVALRAREAPALAQALERR